MTTLRIDILLALHAATHFGLPSDYLLADLRRGRHRELIRPQLESALRDLADQALVTVFETELSARRWRITARGTSALTEEGLV